LRKAYTVFIEASGAVGGHKRLRLPDESRSEFSIRLHIALIQEQPPICQAREKSSLPRESYTETPRCAERREPSLKHRNWSRGHRSGTPNDDDRTFRHSPYSFLDEVRFAVTRSHPQPRHDANRLGLIPHFPLQDSTARKDDDVPVSYAYVRDTTLTHTHTHTHFRMR
jgi:hypothetical protein